MVGENVTLTLICPHCTRTHHFPPPLDLPLPAAIQARSRAGGEISKFDVPWQNEVPTWVPGFRDNSGFPDGGGALSKAKTWRRRKGSQTFSWVWKVTYCS